MIFKQVVSKTRWYLAANINNISKLQDTRPTQLIVCFSKTLLGSTQVLFYSKGKYIKATRSNIDASDWHNLMRIHASTLERDANETESFLLNKICKNILKDTTNNNLDHLDEAMRDAEIVDFFIPQDEADEADEDTVDGCVIS